MDVWIAFNSQHCSTYSEQDSALPQISVTEGQLGNRKEAWMLPRCCVLVSWFMCLFCSVISVLEIKEML